VAVSNPMSSSESLLRPSTSRHDAANIIMNIHGDMLRWGLVSGISGILIMDS
jgi:hypothetical protein